MKIKNETIVNDKFLKKLLKFVPPIDAEEIKNIELVTLASDNTSKTTGIKADLIEGWWDEKSKTIGLCLQPIIRETFYHVIQNHFRKEFIEEILSTLIHEVGHARAHHSIAALNEEREVTTYSHLLVDAQEKYLHRITERVLHKKIFSKTMLALTDLLEKKVREEWKVK